jgi:hypothetical protein
MPIQARPSGQRVGGVSEETDERRSRIRPPSSFDAVVEGIPAFGTASPFAGRRSNVGLGRSVMLDAGILPPSGSAPVTADVRRGTEEGNVVRLRHKAQATAFDGYPSSVGDASFARSFDPFTSPPQQHRGRKPEVVGHRWRHRGRASLRKREEPTPGSSAMDDARLAARHRSRKGAA